MTTITHPSATTPEVGSVPRELARLASLAEQHPVKSALVMLHCADDDQAGVDKLAAELELPAAKMSADRTRYSTGSLGAVNVHVLCSVTEDPHAKRQRLAAELAALDAQIGGQP